MKKIFLAVSLSVLGALYFSPISARSQGGTQTTPPTPQTENQATPQASPVNPAPDPVQPQQPAGTNSNPPTPEITPSGEGTSTSGTSEDYKQFAEYSELKAALSSEPPNWELADQKTYELMLRIVGGTSFDQGYFGTAAWTTLSTHCEAFQDINQLWIQASGGQQGFTKQWEIYNAVNRNSRFYYEKIGWRQVGGAWTVAWRYNSNIRRVEYDSDKKPNFANPPAGQLPAKLEWEDAKDHRFEIVQSCSLAEN